MGAGSLNEGAERGCTAQLHSIIYFEWGRHMHANTPQLRRIISWGDGAQGLESKINSIILMPACRLELHRIGLLVTHQQG